jgi:hypothetical protein
LRQAAESEAAIREQLQRLLTSHQFHRSERLARLLKFIVESGIHGDVAGLKESILGREVYDRGEEFDGRLDPIVRTEVRRLRRKLQEYYQSAGLADPVVIEIPKGGYVPAFRERRGLRPRLEGESIGSYRVIEKLGTGPAGTTYRVVDPMTGDEFAITMLAGDIVENSSTIAALKVASHEAAVLRSETHCGVEEFEESVDGLFLRSPYCEGITLEDQLLSAPLPWTESERVARQLLRSLSIAHRAGVAHGHLKPSNILIAHSDGDLLVRVLGFGTRCLAGRIVLTPSGRQIGTTGYDRCHGTADKSSDVRSAGAILYEVFSGSLPSASVCSDPDVFPWLSDVPVEYRTELAAMIRRCLTANAEQRYVDGVELANAYELIFARSADAVPAPDESTRRIFGQPAVVVAACVLCMVLIVVADYVFRSIK